MVKQVIVMRTDLNMRKGKMIAQGAHATMAFWGPGVLWHVTKYLLLKWLLGPDHKAGDIVGHKNCWIFLCGY